MLDELDGLRLFVGPPLGLQAFQLLSSQTRIYALTPGASLFVAPLTDDLQDAIHSVAGTGNWLEEGPRLATGDMAFAARASKTSSVGYIEACVVEDGIEECGVLWQGGVLALGPMSMTRATSGQRTARPRTLWPINAVLRGLGVSGRGFADEFEAFGLGQYRSLDDIAARARPVTV